jgi:3-hydroxymyristoyl/3-hydroxydecanoyl-(acyl carrier protein) dehydratase
VHSGGMPSYPVVVGTSILAQNTETWKCTTDGYCWVLRFVRLHHPCLCMVYQIGITLLLHSGGMPSYPVVVGTSILAQNTQTWTCKTDGYGWALTVLRLHHPCPFWLYKYSLMLLVPSGGGMPPYPVVLVTLILTQSTQTWKCTTYGFRWALTDVRLHHPCLCMVNQIGITLSVHSGLACLPIL